MTARRVAWAVLLTLLGVHLVAVARFDRTSWPGLIGDEATYAMQALSIAHDFDLRYEREDYDRFVRLFGRVPDGLILQSRDDGARLVFSKPSLYAIAAAPFVRFAPVRGAAIANVLFLALAAIVSARTLERRLGPWAALWVAAFVFASVAFAYAYWIHSDLFQLAAVALGFALVYGEVDRPREGAESPRRWPWWLAGAALGVAAAMRPFHLAFLIPAWAATRAASLPPRELWRRRVALLASCLVLAGFASLAGWLSGGSWSGYAGERQGFYTTTGFPAVDFPASQWQDSVERWGNTSWIHSGSLKFLVDRDLWGWNTVYFLIGENVGVLVYFLPLLLALFAVRWEGARGWLLVAVGAVVACYFLARPFNFYGGGGAIGNRYFLPAYPALWFLAGRAGKVPWLPPLLVTALAAPLLLPLWQAPHAYPQGAAGRYVYVPDLAARYLPYETTQDHIPGGRDVHHNRLWVKFLAPEVAPLDEGARLRLAPGGTADLLLGFPQPLAAVEILVGANGPSKLEVLGRELGPVTLTPTGGVVWRVALGGPDRDHPMWWTREDYPLYRLRFSFPDAQEGVLFTLNPVPGPGAKP